MIHKSRHEEVGHDSEGRSTKSKRLVLDIVTSPALRMNTLICCFLWASVAFGYYGILFASQQFASSLVLVVFVSGLCMAPTGILGVLVINMMSRRAVLSGTFASTALCFLAVFFVPREYEWVQSAVAMIGKVSISLTFGVVYVLTAELFPTDHRNSAIGLASTFGRVGSVIAPFVFNVFGSEDVGNAMAVFGVELLLASAFCLLLVETANKSLPDTVTDVVNFDRLEFIEEALDDETNRMVP